MTKNSHISLIKRFSTALAVIIAIFGIYATNVKANSIEINGDEYYGCTNWNDVENLSALDSNYATVVSQPATCFIRFDPTDMFPDNATIDDVVITTYGNSSGNSGGQNWDLGNGSTSCGGTLPSMAWQNGTHSLTIDRDNCGDFDDLISAQQILDGNFQIWIRNMGTNVSANQDRITLRINYSYQVANGDTSITVQELDHIPGSNQSLVSVQGYTGYYSSTANCRVYISQDCTSKASPYATTYNSNVAQLKMEAEYPNTGNCRKDNQDTYIPEGFDGNDFFYGCQVSVPYVDYASCKYPWSVYCWDIEDGQIVKKIAVTGDPNIKASPPFGSSDDWEYDGDFYTNWETEQEFTEPDCGLDVICHFQNWLEELVKKYFTYSAQSLSGDWSYVSTKLSNKFPFGIFVGLFNLDFDNYASQSGLPINKIDMYMFNQDEVVSYNWSDTTGIVTDNLSTVKTWISVAMWAAFFIYIVQWARMITQSGDQG